MPRFDDIDDDELEAIRYYIRGRAVLDARTASPHHQ